MAQTPATNRQIPQDSILSYYNREIYLGNQFAVPFNFTSAGTTEVPIILLSNASTGVVGVGQKSAFIARKSISSLTSGDSAIIRVYFNPTVTSAGTAFTPINLRPANTNTSVMTVTTAGATALTASSNGTLVEVIESGAFNQQISDLMQIIDPTQSMLITLQASASSEATNTLLSFYEL